MTSSASVVSTSDALDPADDRALQLATCPLCHTVDTVTTVSALDAGGSWRCRTCHQRWNARRLTTVDAYTKWSRERDEAHGVTAVGTRVNSAL